MTMEEKYPSPTQQKLEPCFVRPQEEVEDTNVTMDDTNGGHDEAKEQYDDFLYSNNELSDDDDVVFQANVEGASKEDLQNELR
ncbi:hypothetical protein ACE6H2_020226 [Prunus campanulata]